ncbi:uncharacterized protein LOC134206513 [Armigeres subalbatus]|uniref:uncharacterized protein LOC134206513 n=1 Tax=Armigeres subalbatus TaxID=124917 RepID=UPI002ED1B359
MPLTGCEVITWLAVGLTNNRPADGKTIVWQNMGQAITQCTSGRFSDILVIPSDKGNKTVLMFAEDYKQKMLALVNDHQTYERIPRDPTSRFQNQNNSIVQRIRALDLIDDKTARSLKTYSAVCPKIYGQPKAHKTGLPLRPVVPNMTAPSYNLAKFVASILKQSIESPYNIKDSFSFCEFINGTQLPPNHMLVSLDVTALFTSIPKHLVIENVRQKWNDIKQHTNINQSLFVEIIEFCIDSSYFVYEGQYYKQKFGTAMGNPLSPIAADLVMETLLNTVLENMGFRLPFIRKYVDDLVTAIPLEKLKQLLDAFNSYDIHIQFTHELEMNNRLPYLDMLLIRQQNQRVTTEWYSKPIASGRFLDFYSIHPMSMKLNVAKNFICRVNKLSTSLSDTEKHKIIDDHLKLNHYPSNLRHRLENRMNERRHQTQSNVTEEKRLKYTYRSLAYIPGLSSRIDKLLKKDYTNIKLANYNIKTVRQIFSNIKDPTPPGQQTNAIYNIPCIPCPACYIDMTTNKLSTRMSGHKTHYNTLDRLTATNINITDPQITLLSQKQHYLNIV